jgi:hypothetical protein
VGHSLGSIVVRAALSEPVMKPYLSKLYTFISMATPHLGVVYNDQ